MNSPFDEDEVPDDDGGGGGDGDDDDDHHDNDDDEGGGEASQNDDSRSRQTNTTASSRPQQAQPPRPRPVAQQQQYPATSSVTTQQQHQHAATVAAPHNAKLYHQPHGVSALSIGPSASNVSSTWSLSQQQQQQQQPSSSQQQHIVSHESPLPPVVQRSLGDRSNEKRKNAALEIEALVKSLQEAHNIGMIRSVINVLSKDFCTSMNSNYRKGGLIGLAATAIGLLQHASHYLNVLLPPVLHCFDDPESRVRYYACESLYNIAKVSRRSILSYFNQIFEGLTKLYADVDVDVKNGANLLDRLIKDIVCEAEGFAVDSFLPLLQNYIRRTNPYIRQLVVGWIVLLDSIPDISMLDYLPDFLDGLFNMLSDANREIRQAADSALSDFLRELSVSQVLEFGPIVSILNQQCRSKERLNRLTAITWLAELIHHPYSGGDALLGYHADILGAILWCISDGEKEIRLVAERTNDDLLNLVQHTEADFELNNLLQTLTTELLKEDVPTKMAVLRWINMLMEKRKADMNAFTETLLPVLLRTLSDPSDAVVLLDLQVLSRISLAQRNELGYAVAGAADHETEEAQFQLVLNAILNLFSEDRQLLETRGSLIIRKLCVLLNAKAVYMRISDTLSAYETTIDGEPADYATLQFVGTMVQTLNLILLTASELQELRALLAASFQPKPRGKSSEGKKGDEDDDLEDDDDGGYVFATLFHCWSHNSVATFSLCLLAQAFDLSFALVKTFSEMPEVSVGFLMQIDKLVHLLESPIFVHLRLQLLDVEADYHAPLLKSIYGLLMCLPQGEAFRLLNERLTTVCNLRDNLGMNAISMDPNAPDQAPPPQGSIVSTKGLDMSKLLQRFDAVTEMHRVAHEKAQRKITHEDIETPAAATPTHYHRGDTSGMANFEHITKQASKQAAMNMPDRSDPRGKHASNRD